MIRHFGDKSQRHGFGPFFLRYAVFGGGPNGLDLLNNSLVWWDVLDAEPTTDDAVVSADVSTWAQTNCTVTSGVSDPDGGSNAYRITASAAGAFRVQPAQNFDIYGGYLKVQAKIRVLEAAPIGANKVRLSPTATNTSYLEIPKPSAEDADWNDTGVPVLSPDGEDWPLGFRWLQVDAGDWRDLMLELSETEVVTTQFAPRIGSTATASGDAFEVYDVQFEQRRIESVAPRVGAATLSASAQANEPVLVGNAWLGQRCAMAAPSGTTAMTASVAVGAGAWLAAGTMVPTRTDGYNTTPDPVILLTGTTANVQLTAIEGAVGNNYQGSWGWSWTNDAGSTTSGDFGVKMPSVPVAVALYYDGAGNLYLYVDGNQVGSASVSGTATITGFEVRGRECRACWTSWALRSDTHTPAEVSAICSTLRSEASLPTRWKIVHHSGQSNSTNSSVFCNVRAAQGPFRIGNAFTRREADTGVPVVPWAVGTQPRYWTHSSIGNISWGPGRWFLREAEAADEYGLVVVATGRGGTGIDNWVTDGLTPDMYTHTTDELTDALADLGTHLYEYGLMIWIQGEADGTYGTAFAGGYEAALDALADKHEAQLGGDVPFVYLRLNTNFTSGDAGTRGAVRDAQDAYDAYPNAIMYLGDFASPYYDGIHYSVLGGRANGRNAYRALRSLSLVTP